MNKEDSLNKRTVRKAVDAYKNGDKRFDPYGSYTGSSEEGKPCQDADDL